MYEIQMLKDYVTKSEFKASMDDIGQNFKAVFNRFDSIDNRFDLIDDKFDQIDARFDRLEASVDSRFAAVDLRFNRLDHTMGIMNTNISLILRHLGISETQTAI